MPIVGDFSIVSHQTHAPTGRFGNLASPYIIGDNSLDQPLELSFGTGGRHNSPALITMMVRSLTDGHARVVLNNDHEIGRISPSSSEDQSTWRQEQFVVHSNILSGANSDEANTLQIFPVQEADDVPGDHDDFFVRDIVCFFHQQT